MRGGEIVAVGPAVDVAAALPELPERDLGDAVLLPGLVDAHCHLEWSLTGGLIEATGFAAWLARMLELGQRMDPDDHRAAAMLGALRCLEHGTTTVADSGPTGAAAPALRAGGIRGVVHLETFGRHRGGAARDAAAALAERVAALDGADGAVRIGVSPHAPYTVGPDYWEALATHPELERRPWATHLAESPDESRLLASGGGPLADLFTARGSEPGRWPGQGGPVARLDAAGALRPGLVAAHCVQLEPGDPERLRDRGVGVAHCPASNARIGCGRAPIELLHAAGVAVGLGSDSPASAGGYDLRTEVRRLVEVHGDVATPEPADRLALATLGGARALGMDDEVGTLEAGKRADLIAVAGPAPDDPHRRALDPDAPVVLVMVGGAVVAEGGSPAQLDREAVLAHAAEARARLTG